MNGYRLYNIGNYIPVKMNIENEIQSTQDSFVKQTSYKYNEGNNINI